MNGQLLLSLLAESQHRHISLKQMRRHETISYQGIDLYFFADFYAMTTHEMETDSVSKVIIICAFI